MTNGTPQTVRILIANDHETVRHAISNHVIERQRARGQLGPPTVLISFMTKIELDFVPTGAFERRLVYQIQDDIRARLEGHDITGIKIVLTKSRYNQIAFDFVGDPENIDKAKRLLAVD